MTRFHAPIAEQIWDMKYRFKEPNGKPIDMTVEDTWRRIAKSLAQVEVESPPSPIHSPAELVQKHERNFYDALEDWKYVPAGRIVAGAGTARAVTLFNCFVMGTIPDSMDGIFSMLREAALTMQQGGGIGYDFSPIRPSTSRVKKLGADASGPLSFMDCWDAMCRTVMSAGSRRGAMMATMRCDHPDVAQFIEAKRDSAKLRMFNLSVLVTDAFMQAVKDDADWPLVHVEPPAEGFGETPIILDNEGDDGRGNKNLPRYVHAVVKARNLWDQIMKATYDVAEPGVIFIDRINSANNLNYCETISSTNPCGEQPLPPYGACLLGSINLVKFIVGAFTRTAIVDKDALRKTVRTAIRMMDNVIDTSNFPLESQREEAKNKRRIGLGVTGLADALIMLGIRYGSDRAVEMTEAILKLVALESYWASVALAQEKGAFPLFDADEYLDGDNHVSQLCEHDPALKLAIQEHGIRNALLTSIAPTGTISMYAGNVSSGVEPVFAMSFKRKVLLPDGSHMEETVEDYALAAYREWRMSDPDITSEEGIDLMSGSVPLPDYFVTAQTLEPADHVRMQAAAQKWVDSAISKTVNLPEDISFEDFKAVYWDAYESGCKGCTTYRPNDVTGSVLSVEEDDTWADTAEFLVEVQRIHDMNVADMGQEGRDHWFSCLEMFEVDKAADLPVEARQEFIDFMQSTEDLTEDVDFSEECGVEDDEDTSLEVLIHSARGHIMTEEESTAQAQSLARGFMPMSEELPARPEELKGSTYKIKVGDQSAVYLTVNDVVESNGVIRPFEIFLRSSDPNHDEWMVAIARTISAVLRRPYDARFLADELKQVHSHATGGFGMGGYTPSLVAAIGKKLGEHMDHLKADNEAVAVFKTANTGKSEHIMQEAFEKAFRENPDSPLAVQTPQTSAKAKPCPQCHGYNFKVEAGCPSCLDCGWSKCG